MKKIYIKIIKNIKKKKISNILYIFKKYWKIISILFLILITIFITLSKLTINDNKLDYQIDIISNSCEIDNSILESVNIIDNKILINTTIKNLPNPCYNVKGYASISGKNININLNTEKIDAICIQCESNIVTQITISNLDSGKYNVIINSPSGYFNINDLKI